MAGKTVTVVSKPHLVPQLRSTWRKSTEHYLAQLKRFLIVFVGALIPQILAGGFNNFGTDTLKALAPAAALVAIRQVYPELGAASVDSAPGVTIVPSQVQPDPPADITKPAVSPDATPTGGDGFQAPGYTPPTEGDAAP